MRRQLLPAIGMLFVFSVLTGLAYPLAVTGVAQVAFASKASGSDVRVGGTLVGSTLIGQPFSAAKYFHPRPSASGYVAGAEGGGTYSYGSNYGPLDRRLVGNLPGINIAASRNRDATDDDPTCVVPEGEKGCDPNTVAQRALAFRALNGLGPSTKIPVDAVTASASGLDPHISIANARLQASRVADARGMPVTRVLALVRRHTDGRAFGFLGEPGVNVLRLNVALDEVTGGQ